jgi:mannitol-1-phosphate 5-dehydrogenase
MSARTGRRFVGFGFGPIQIGLMMLEASESGSFDELVAAEIDRETVSAVRANGGSVTVNVARADGIIEKLVKGIRIFNPRVEDDRAALVDAVGKADEMATALPRVAAYEAEGDASPAAVIADGLTDDRPRIVYTAENDNFAAEKLTAAIRARAPGSDGCNAPAPSGRLLRFQALDTVIAKMSGSISSAEEMRALGLAPLIPGFSRCVLVEEFNRIFVSRIRLPGFTRGIRVFEEKDDLLPFEEAKLYGHNAVHAVLGYLAWLKGITVMSGIREDGELLELGRRTFLEESGAALIAKHGAGGEALFTSEGWRAYAEDLLTRMTNPFLHDSVERITRDPRRKLGYSDRLVGAMREALVRGIKPRGLAMGAAAAVIYALELETAGGKQVHAGRARPSTSAARSLVQKIWAGSPDDGLKEKCASMILDAARELWEKDATSFR